MSSIPYIFLGYGTLLLIGGLIGYYQSGSSASLVTACIASALCDFAGLGLLRRWPFSFHLSVAVTGAMTFFFAYRYYLTHKLMPGGLFALVSLGMLALLIWYKSRKSDVR